MSIIYDALKKTQTHRAETGSTNQNNSHLSSSLLKRRRRLIFIMLALVVAILITCFAVIFSKKANSVAPVPPVKKSVYHPKTLVLNGVFLSDQTKVAMINNQLVKLGESINDLKVISIESDRVTLQNQRTTIVLRV